MHRSLIGGTAFTPTSMTAWPLYILSWSLCRESTTYTVLPLSHLLGIVLFVCIPSDSIFRHPQNVACGVFVKVTCSLCCYSTYRMYSTQVNLKIICSGTFLGLWTPSTLTSRLIKSTVVWVITWTIVAAGRHLSIWNSVWVCHAHGLTYWKRSSQISF